MAWYITSQDPLHVGEEFPTALSNVGPTSFAWGSAHRAAGRAEPSFAFTLHKWVLLLLTRLNEPKHLTNWMSCWKWIQWRSQSCKMPPDALSIPNAKTEEGEMWKIPRKLLHLVHFTWVEVTNWHRLIYISVVCWLQSTHFQPAIISKSLSHRFSWHIKEISPFLTFKKNPNKLYTAWLYSTFNI